MKPTLALLALGLLLFTGVIFAQDSDSQPDSAAISNSDETSPAASPHTQADILADSATISGRAGVLYRNGEPLYPMPPERKALLEEYSDFVDVWRFVDFFSGLLVLGIVLFTGLSHRLSLWAKRLRQSYLVVWLYTTLVVVALSMLSFPFTFYRGYYIEKEFGFLNQTFGQWFGEQLLGLLVVQMLAPIPVYLFHWMVQRFRRWWLVFSIVSMPLLVVLIVLAPVVIAPLFNTYEPLQDKQLEHEILTLAGKAGIEGSDVFQVDASRQSSKVNAYVTGLFGTKRIVLYDTLIKGFTYDEIKYVMGHEMGHYVMRHIWWGLAIAVVFLFASLWIIDKTIHRAAHRFRHHFGFERISELASFPLVLAFLSIIMFVGQPVTNYFSRVMEYQSDRFGLEIARVPTEAAVASFEKLSAYNLSNPDPNPLVEFWFYTHPSLKNRIEEIREFRKVP